MFTADLEPAPYGPGTPLYLSLPLAASPSLLGFTTLYSLPRAPRPSTLLIHITMSAHLPFLFWFPSMFCCSLPRHFLPCAQTASAASLHLYPPIPKDLLLRLLSLHSSAYHRLPPAWLHSGRKHRRVSTRSRGPWTLVTNCPPVSSPLVIPSLPFTSSPVSHYSSSTQPLPFYKRPHHD